jgi:hypothetical protein
MTIKSEDIIIHAISHKIRKKILDFLYGSSKIQIEIKNSSDLDHES